MKKILYVIPVVWMLASCAMNNDVNRAGDNQKNGVRVQNTANNTAQYKSNEKISAHLASVAERVPNVKDATAIVIGPYAVVGIDVNGKMDRSRVETIKYTVAESLKNDPHGKNAVVVADVDTYQRLKEMGNQIRAGKPEGVMEELAAIIGRVMPQIPSDTMDSDRPNPTKQNDKQLPEHEKEQLKKEQEDQSNHHLKR
ncbi:MAG: YhcN/YlaJ family sporulation lipoprotein [Ectobacillus sp.]